MFYVVSVCLYVCNTVTFESLDVESSFFVCYLHMMPVRFVCEGYRVKVKVTATKVLNSLFPQCKTSVSSNSGSV